MQMQRDRRNPLLKDHADHAECHRSQVTAAVSHFFKHSEVEMTVGLLTRAAGCSPRKQRSKQNTHLYTLNESQPFRKPYQDYVLKLWPKGVQSSKRI